jgi:putative ABC transport system permease protein
MFRATRVFLRRLLRRDRFERELADELQFHLEARVDDLVGRGLDPAAARRRARVEFGGVEQYTERLRARRPGASLDALVQDVRLSVRGLRREPTFALAVTLTLSLGVGASTAVFGMASTTRLSRIPFSEPDRLVVGRSTLDGAGGGFVSGLDYFDYRDASRSFDGLAAFYPFPDSLAVTGRGDPWHARAGYVTWNLFRTLGVRPVVGRDFLPEEEAEVDARVAIISDGLWRGRFGGSADVLGRTLVLDGTPYTIVGVLPREFRFVFDADVYRVAARPGETRNRHNYHLVGRLKPGVSLAGAQQDVDAIARALAREYPDTDKGMGLRFVSLQQYLGGGVRAGLLLPVAATAGLLLIACANAAGLLLARGQRRMPEVAMRSALGASRWRLVRQHLTESVVLSLPASLLGVGVAYVLQGLLLYLLPVGRLGVDRPVVDGLVLLFALAASVATGLVVGLVPALRGAAVSLSPHLGAWRQAGGRTRSARLRSGLVVVQIAVSVVLLVGAGLLARSLLRLSAVDLGFSPDRVLAARIEAPATAFRERASRQALFSSILGDVRALPGVRSAGATNALPIQDPGNIWRTRVADRPLPAGERGERTFVRLISSGYFATMNMPIVRGRGIWESDRDGAPAVAVISESLARRLFPGQDPLGRTVVLIDSLRATEVAYQIVGLVRDARLSDPRVEGNPAMYLSFLQASPGPLRIVVRTAGPATDLAAPIREIVRRHGRDALMTDVSTMDAVVDESLAGFRRVVRYLGLFAGLALLLAAVGLYGALAYHVSQQEHELGVRLAMGATRVGILGLVFRRGAGLVVTGLLMGVAAAYPGTRLVRGLLFDTLPLDPAAYAGAALALGLVAAAACLVPAVRAIRVDPAVVLRSE